MDEQNLCTVCGIDMGPQNPRQLCGKIYCMNEPSLSENTEDEIVEDGDNEETGEESEEIE